jgi:hypothetical protein
LSLPLHYLSQQLVSQPEKILAFQLVQMIFYTKKSQLIHSLHKKLLSVSPQAQQGITEAPPLKARITYGRLYSNRVATQLLNTVLKAFRGEKLVAHRGKWELLQIGNQTQPTYVLTGITGSVIRTETGWETYSESQYRDYFIHPETGLPRGGYAKVWNLEGATHGGGNNYTVAASVSYFREPTALSGNQIFGLSIDPVKLDNAIPKPLTTFPFRYGARYNFPADIEYQVKLRTGQFKNTAGGWFNGRIFDPFISQTGSTLTLSGKPTRVLAAHTGPISCESNTALLKTPSFSEKCRTKDASWATMVHPNSQSLGSSIEANTQPSATYPDGAFAYFEPILKPVGFTSEWNAYSWGVSKSGNCQIEDGKIALVSSNATLYSVNPPAWDPVEQSLAYRVGSLHLDHTGALHKGNFNLAVPKNFAKCLWGQNIFNAKATVAITNTDGTNNVATSVLSQDDQMIYFKVAGFTFSTPQIKVKLEIPKVEPTPTPTATIKPVPVQKTITCIKGKLVKKVSAVTPKCPVGFKKK